MYKISVQLAGLMQKAKWKKASNPFRRFLQRSEIQQEAGSLSNQ